MKQAFQRSDLPSKTDLVSLVNKGVLIRPPVLTVTSTVNPSRCPAIVTDSCCDVFPLKSIRYGSFSITGDSPRRTRFHSHSIINRPPKPAWLKGLAVINIGRYRHFYRKKRASFASAGDGAICGVATLTTPSSINSHHTEQGSKLQLLRQRNPTCRNGHHRHITQCGTEPSRNRLQRKT